jgi:hypothetical protein
MAILSDTALEMQAIKHTHAVVQRFIVGTTTYDLGRSAFEWNGHLRRYVFRQPLVIWRDATEVEITLSLDKRHVVRFRDPRRFEGAVFRKLDDGALLAIAQTTGLVGKLAKLDDVQPGPLYQFSVRQREPGLPRRLKVTVNASKRQVAAFEVTEDGR